MKTINKTLLVTIGVALTLTLSACTGCSSHNWSSESEISSTTEQRSESSSEVKPKTYKIKWVNYNDELLYTSRNVPEGEIPVYRGETPTRPASGEYKYSWDGWTPEVVPATQNATYKATYTTETNTFTVSFYQGDPNVKYSQTCIEDVPYNSMISIAGECIYINDICVTAETTLSDEEKPYYNFNVYGWNIDNEARVTSDLTLQAYANLSVKRYDFGVSATNGSISYYLGQDLYVGTEYYAEQVKAYEGHIMGGTEGEIVTSNKITFESYQSINNDYLSYSFSVETSQGGDQFSTYEFDGWYCNGEPLRYETPLYGDIVLEARYKQYRTDYSYIFEYEFDNLRREAIIVGVKEEYQHTSFPAISIPATINNGWPVTGVKNGALAKVGGLQELYIPNTLIYFEEMDDYATFPQGLQKIYLEEDNYHFHLMEGILYNYDLTEILVGTKEALSYTENNSVFIPEIVTHIWSHAFRYLDLEHVALPSGLTEITNYCFFANNLQEITIPEGVTKIGDLSFGCNDMVSVTIPDACKSIGCQAFYNCMELKSVSIGAGLENLDDSAFRGSKKIEMYFVNENNRFFAAYEGAIYSKDLTIIYRYPSALSVDPHDHLAPQLTEITYYAFEKCGFTTFHIPEGITKISGSGLHECEYLTEIYFPMSIQYVGRAVFGCCYEINYAYYPGTVAQWQALSSVDMYWGQTLRNLQVLTCSDGTVEVKKFNA